MKNKNPPKKPVKKAKKELKELNVIVLSGEKDAERAIFGLAYALCAATVGYKVTVFLAMDGAALAYRDIHNKVLVKRYQTIPHYLNLLEEFGVRIGVCSTCTEDYCEEEIVISPGEGSVINTPHSFTKPRELRKGIEIMGMTSFLTATMNADTIVF